MAIIRSNNGTYPGTRLPDIFRDRDGDAVLKGLGGNDRFFLGGGNDRVSGGGGNDLFVLAADDQTGSLVGGAGADTYRITDGFSGRISIQFDEGEGDAVRILKEGYAERTNAAGDTILVWRDGSHVTLVGSGDGGDDSMPMVPADTGRGWWVGSPGEDFMISDAYQNFSGRGGLDYISGSDAGNIILTGSNTGTWDGTFGNSPDNTTYIDAERGDDDIYVNATRGAFDIKTGLDGADDVYVYGGTFVSINDMLDGATEGDSFHFSAKFRGDGDRASLDGEVWSFDDSNDKLVLHGNWALDQAAEFEATFVNRDTGALVLVRGFEQGTSIVEFVM